MTEFWFPITIMVVSIFVFVFSIKCKEDRSIEAFCSCVLLIILLIVWPITYSVSVGTVSDMEAFANATKSAYEYTITSTQEVEIKAVSSAEPSTYEILDTGGLAYLKLGSQASERIRELRVKVEWYNAMLERYKRFNAFWFTQGFITNVPEDMVPIILK